MSIQNRDEIIIQLRAEIERLRAEQSPPIDRSVLVRWYRYDPAFHRLVDSLVVERLRDVRAEIERLRAENDSLKHDYGIELRDAAAEIERLKAALAAETGKHADDMIEAGTENERLKAELARTLAEVERPFRAEIGRLLATLEAEQRASARAEAEIERLKDKSSRCEEYRLDAIRSREGSERAHRRIDVLEAEIERLRAELEVEEAHNRVIGDLVRQRDDAEAKLKRVATQRRQ